MSLSPIEPSFADTTSFNKASRGLIASLHPCIIKDSTGQVVWNNDDYRFLQQHDCPATVNPKLWRQGQLTAKQGLFRVTEGIYQVRGFDIYNMTFVESETGVIVLDCLQSVETAAAALTFYRRHRGKRKVVGVVISHPHFDHYDGAAGVVTSDDIPVIAPAGLMDEILKEGMVAGPAMRRRAVFMFGDSLPKGPRGHVGCGLGMAGSIGKSSLVPPTDSIHTTGEERVVDGVRLVFQMVPESEAPCEINISFPDYRALWIAECATNTMHNVITLRGAQVRDAKKWSRYLDETLVLYSRDTDVLFSSHHWPTWGSDKITTFLSDQRDLYAYTHDQTVRLMNQGLTGTEIAEELRLPPALQKQWYARGYYGALSQNVKGIYQHYMTWFDGNPANLWKHPPKEEGMRYVECMGGVENVLQKAREFADVRGDLRFAATLLDHVVMAEPGNQEGREQLAIVYQRLAWGAENAVWRNFYLTAAQRLQGEAQAGRSVVPLSRFHPQATVENWLDALSLQLDGGRASSMEGECCVVFRIAELKECWMVRLRNAALTYRTLLEGVVFEDLSVDAVAVKLSRAEMYELLAQGRLKASEESREGSIGVLTTILELCGIACTYI